MRFCVSHHSVYFCKVLLPLQENISQNNPKGLKQNFSQLYPCLTTKVFSFGFAEKLHKYLIEGVDNVAIRTILVYSF